MLDYRNGFAYAIGCSTCAMGLKSRCCKMTKTFDTCDSHVVPHRSTEQAQWCLTSEFGWDPVLSPWYDRMMWMDAVDSMRSVHAFSCKTGVNRSLNIALGPRVGPQSGALVKVFN